MMPQLLTVRVKSPNGRRPIRVWVPVLPVLLILSPLVLLSVVVAAVACVVFKIGVLRGLGTGWRLFSALPGTRIEVEDGRMALLMKIS